MVIPRLSFSSAWITGVHHHACFHISQTVTVVLRFKHTSCALIYGGYLLKLIGNVVRAYSMF